MLVGAIKDNGGLHPDLVVWNDYIDSGSAFMEYEHNARFAKLSTEDQRELKKSIKQVISQCSRPGIAQRRTGLVLGKIQAGKTMNFTGVVAMAADSGIRVAVVLAGTKNMLKDQTTSRLQGDLGNKHLVHFEYGTSTQPSELSRALKRAMRRDKMLVIYILKRSGRRNGKSIDGLVDILRKLPPQLKAFVDNSGAIIIDDESDEASLDGNKRSRLRSKNKCAPPKKPTATYSAVVGLRQMFRTVTYLQYTATPQANLLLDRIDLLSPDFCVL